MTMHRLVSLNTAVRENKLRQPFSTSQDSAPRTHAEAVAIEWKTDSGIVGQSEAVPVRYVTGETLESVIDDIGFVSASLDGVNALDWWDVCGRLDVCVSIGHTARAGLELAAWDARRRALRISLADSFGGTGKPVVTDITIPMTDTFLEAALLAVECGATILKVKTGSEDWQSDVDRIQRIQLAHPKIKFRVDANQGYDVTGALGFAKACFHLGLPVELIEQPTPAHDITALCIVAARSPIPIFADESVLTAADAIKVLSNTQVHGVNIKLMKSGLQGALDIIAIARACRKRLMIGCMMETYRGIAPSVALACATGVFHHVDLDAPLLIDDQDPAGCHYHGCSLSTERDKIGTTS